jgi:hypothetical protein
VRPVRAPQAPLKVGDRVRCKCADPWLSGHVVRVIGLGVLSCQGFVGVAVQYSPRGYCVLREGEFERV